MPVDNFSFPVRKSVRMSRATCGKIPSLTRSGFAFAQSGLRSLYRLSPLTRKKSNQEQSSPLVGLDLYAQRVSLSQLHPDCRLLNCFGEESPHIPRQNSTSASLTCGHREIVVFPRLRRVETEHYHLLQFTTQKIFAASDVSNKKARRALT